MAKFTSGDLRLKDGQKVTFGTNLDSNVLWDPTAAGGSSPGGDLIITTTVSGVDPLQAHHLSTKYYVDQEITTLSGNMVLDHGGLDGLGDDDHTQYSLVDGSRAFSGTVGGVTPTADAHLTTKLYVDTISGTLGTDIDAVSSSLTSHTGDSSIHFTEGSIDHGSIAGLTDDDHTQYIRADGLRPFSSTVSGVTPTVDAHLATKGYVDSVATGLDWQDSVLDITSSGSASEVEGNRYIASETSGGWTEDYVYEYDGTAWVETVVSEGMSAWVEDEDVVYVYNGSDWVKFGSTTTHNNLSGLQGGTSDEYYHMTSTQHSALTDQGGVTDASSQHIHDSRYYTETEIDTISGSLSAEIDSDISTHESGSSHDSRYYTETELDNGQLDNRYYTETEIDTISGSINTNLTAHTGDSTIHFTEASIDHGSIGGLGDDDHTQYVPVDGSRGFTATVSGVTPVAGYDLTTKDYVDGVTSAIHGRQSLGNGVSVVSPSFSDLGHTNYTVNATLENITDSPPSIYAFIVSARSSSGFTITLMGDTDSANYVLNWSIVLD